MNRGAAKGVTVAFHGIKAGLEELLLGLLRHPGKGGGGSIGERAAEAFDGLKGLFVVDDDGGDILVGLIERREGNEATVGEQLCGGDDGGGQSCGGGSGKRRRRDVNARFPVIPVRCEGGNEKKAGGDGEE